MNIEELKQFIEENIEIGLYTNKNWTEDKLFITALLRWKDNPYKSFSESTITLNIDKKDSVYC